MFASLFGSPAISSSSKLTAPKRQSPILVIVLAFLALITLGASLLYLPIAQHASQPASSFFDCLFTATSAVTLTGLDAVRTPNHWTIFGQSVILGLVQLGALIYMIAATIFALRLGLRLGLRRQLQLPETHVLFQRRDLFRVARYVVFTTLAIELIGAILLTIRMYPHAGNWAQASFAGAYYAISAFCNAGFVPSLGGAGLSHGLRIDDGLGGDILLVGLVGLLALFGGVGISVLTELRYIHRLKRFSLHTKLVLAMTVLLVLLGAGFFYLFEYIHPGAGTRVSSVGSQAVNALFMSVSSRSAGFSLFSMHELSPPSWGLLLLLMFIGGAPGSAASGVKITTIAVIMLAILTLLRRRSDIEVYRRRISGETVRLALSLVFLSLLVLIFFVTAIGVIEFTSHGAAATTATVTAYARLVFEVASAFGNVGFPTGVSASLHPVSRGLLLVAMLLGRLGPLIFVYIFSQPKRPLLRRLPAETVMTG